MRKIFVLILLLATTTTFAQMKIRPGVIAGFEISNMEIKVPNDLGEFRYDESLSPKGGYKFGLLGEYMFFSDTDSRVGIEVGGVWSQRGFKYKETYSYDDVRVFVKGTDRINYLMVPVNLKGGFGANDWYWDIFAGFYVGGALNGKRNVEFHYIGPEIDERVAENRHLKFGRKYDYNKYDFGWQIGTGIEYKGIFARLQVDLGRRNLTATSMLSQILGDLLHDDLGMRNLNVGLSVGYLIGR